jgi:hypothetical protein
MKKLPRLDPRTPMFMKRQKSMIVSPIHIPRKILRAFLLLTRVAIEPRVTPAERARIASADYSKISTDTAKPSARLSKYLGRARMKVMTDDAETTHLLTFNPSTTPSPKSLWELPISTMAKTYYVEKQKQGYPDGREKTPHKRAQGRMGGGGRSMMGDVKCRLDRKDNRSCCRLEVSSPVARYLSILTPKNLHCVLPSRLQSTIAVNTYCTPPRATRCTQRASGRYFLKALEFFYTVRSVEFSRRRFRAHNGSELYEEMSDVAIEKPKPARKKSTQKDTRIAFDSQQPYQIHGLRFARHRWFVNELFDSRFLWAERVEG